MQRVKPYFGRYSLKAQFEVDYCEPLDLTQFQTGDGDELYIEVANIKLANDPSKRPNLEAMLLSYVHEALSEKFGDNAKHLKVTVLPVELIKQSSAW